MAFVVFKDIMSPIIFYWTGHKNQLLSSIKRSISGLTSSCENGDFKIGITECPDTRWRQAYKHEYERMHALYRTTSPRVIRSLEKELTEYYWERVCNQRHGGGGFLGQGPYYLYVVLKENSGSNTR